MKAIAGTIAQLDENSICISVAVQQQDAVSKEIARNANAAAERTRKVSANLALVSDSAAKAGELANAVTSAGAGFESGLTDCAPKSSVFSLRCVSPNNPPFAAFRAARRSSF